MEINPKVTTALIATATVLGTSLIAGKINKKLGKGVALVGFALLGAGAIIKKKEESSRMARNRRAESHPMRDLYAAPPKRDISGKTKEISFEISLTPKNKAETTPIKEKINKAEAMPIKEKIKKTSPGISAAMLNKQKNAPKTPKDNSNTSKRG